MRPFFQKTQRDHRNVGGITAMILGQAVPSGLSYFTVKESDANKSRSVAKVSSSKVPIRPTAFLRFWAAAVGAYDAHAGSVGQAVSSNMDSPSLAAGNDLWCGDNSAMIHARYSQRASVMPLPFDTRRYRYHDY